VPPPTTQSVLLMASVTTVVQPEHEDADGSCPAPLPIVLGPRIAAPAVRLPGSAPFPALSRTTGPLATFGVRKLVELAPVWYGNCPALPPARLFTGGMSLAESVWQANACEAVAYWITPPVATQFTIAIHVAVAAAVVPKN